MIKYFLLWFPMLVIAIANGVLREWYQKITGELLGHQISSFTLILFFGFYINWVITQFPLKNAMQALLLGLVWLILTLMFEFGFGLYRGSSWSDLLGAYNIFKGKLWVLIPIWVAIAPYIFYKLK